MIRLFAESCRDAQKRASEIRGVQATRAVFVGESKRGNKMFVASFPPDIQAECVICGATTTSGFSACEECSCDPEIFSLDFTGVGQ